MSNYEGMMVLVFLGLITMSPDVVDWVCDKVADAFNKRNENKK